jgi:membrane protease YdiL (CAAX protease family)
MSKNQELEPLKIESKHLFTIFASAFWIIFFIGGIQKYFADYIADPIIRKCIFGGVLDLSGIVLLLGIHRLQRWPAINPLRMGLFDHLVAGIVGVLQLFPLTLLIGVLWHGILSLLTLTCVEQSIITLWRTQLTNEGQFLGIMFLVVILAPIAEEILFRYFFYRFFKARLSSWQAMLLVSFLFAQMHFNLAAFMPLWVMGIFLTFLYERHGNLIPCILVHSLFNYIALVVAILAQRW